jgi:glycosyltransferase involved in cell wall biosynthesis
MRAARHAGELGTFFIDLSKDPAIGRALAATPPALHQLTVTVVVPTLNEEQNLRWLLPQLTHADEVVVVDGQSTDGTLDVVRELCPRAVVVSLPPNGKGGALRAGFATATCDVVVMLDADGSMDPLEMDAYLALIRRGFDVVKGSRYSCGGGSEDLTFVRRTGNRFLTRLANLIYGTKWTDMCYGYIALRRSSIPKMNLDAEGFEIETQICVHAVTHGLKVAEVPSYELNRRFGESHLHPVRDGLRVLRVLLTARFRSTAPASRLAVPAAAADEVQAVA